MNRYLGGYLVSQQQTGVLNDQQEKSNSTESTFDGVIKKQEKQASDIITNPKQSIIMENT